MYANARRRTPRSSLAKLQATQSMPETHPRAAHRDAGAAVILRHGQFAPMLTILSRDSML
jgi:hypothetical protein